jgi:nucleoside-diphosphate-sugar epimerase
VWVLGDTRGPADESAATDHPSAAVAWRPSHERLVLDAAGGQLVTAVVRPGMVYGGTRGLITPWFAQARSGGAQVVGDGKNHWSFVHVDDLAQLYRLVVERRAGGVFHGVDGSAPTLEEAARAASAAVGGTVRHVLLEEARKAMGPMADALAMDQVVVAHRGAEVGWKPGHPAFVQAAAAAAREANA